MSRMNELECYNSEKGYGLLKVTTLAKSDFRMKQPFFRLLSVVHFRNLLE